jgi:hypothetical protein
MLPGGQVIGQQTLDAVRIKLVHRETPHCGGATTVQSPAYRFAQACVGTGTFYNAPG